MIIYFVRHGESEGNSQNTHQFSHTPLSEKGREQ
ncbi:MAG: histidine phosphatase family protein, partial [Candidatus Methanofastidiosa archaeon]|nr:histidine phosphatase family protein [Candidatus Methanofastidiosa archaeon]